MPMNRDSNQIPDRVSFTDQPQDIPNSSVVALPVPDDAVCLYISTVTNSISIGAKGAGASDPRFQIPTDQVVQIPMDENQEDLQLINESGGTATVSVMWGTEQQS